MPKSIHFVIIIESATMSAPTSTKQTGQKPQASIPSTQTPATKTSIAPSTKKHRHSTFPQPKNPQSAKPASNVIASRIEKKKPTTHRSRKTASATAPEFRIRIFINNRLGNRREILCSPSATIGAFKGVAAKQLGTRPEAILLKRQGERPFKDSLTLEDYEIGDGSSLDFEIDTGDS